MANKFYTVKKTINGIEYTAQFNGLSAALQAIDNSYVDGTTNTSLKKLSKYLFDNVIVEPKISIESFGADKIGQAETKTVNGTEYTAVFKGLGVALEAVDNSYIDGTTNTSLEKLTSYLLEKVIVEPKELTVDSFDSMEDMNAVIAFARDVMQGGKVMEEFNEIVAFAREVMQGNFRDQKENAGSTKAKGKR